MIKRGWQALEEWVAEKLRAIDPGARRTKGSGNGTEILDVLNNYIWVSCKDSPKQESFTIEHSGRNGWEHDQLKLPLSTSKPLIRFVRNKFGQTLACMDADDFFDKFLIPLEHYRNSEEMST
jgi:hypothetical protein